jgi:hypothetical protein
MVEEELKCIAFPDIRNTSCCITVKFSYQKKKTEVSCSEGICFTHHPCKTNVPSNKCTFKTINRELILDE